MSGLFELERRGLKSHCVISSQTQSFFHVRPGSPETPPPVEGGGSYAEPSLMASCESKDTCEPVWPPQGYA